MTLSTKAPELLLPSHTSFTTEDPLGFSSTDEYPVPVYAILKSHLLDRFGPSASINASQSVVNDFVTAISDLSYTIHNHPDPNLNILKSCLVYQENPLALIRSIVDTAAALPKLFPSNSLPPLSPRETRIYTKPHLLALLSHQLLLTLPTPSWNNWGGANLSSWFSDSDSNTEPKRTYTNITLEYLTHTSPSSQPQEFHFNLHHCPSLPELTKNTPLLPLTVLEFPQESDFPATTFPKENIHTTYIISSHHLIGHGPAATQEERLLASIPELLPVSTFTPPLEENTALAVTASAENGFVPTAVFTGHGRTARLDKSYDKEDYEGENKANRIRANTFLFLNATELDTLETPDSKDGKPKLPDFLPGMLEKDLLKAYTGFSDVFESQKSKEGKNQRIIATPWGSGAFGGDVRVKLLILWVAASFAAGVLEGCQEAELVFLVKEWMIDTKEEGWKESLWRIKDSGVGAHGVWRGLVGLRERGGMAVFEDLVGLLGIGR